ncbi:hypothetical protein K493DRAFT_337378 [Basidiobolus meristosporus CBS 931.73]|uniref:Uncharacterized protein n=1 Tax=Basidiobolus meristosporus CBS 931.73 TaxID=1314790 RepID=A0A1Y1YCQ5_9FUNG|nr:hypothetical protein K493DRAFT_337378 [Basidiobolus meristosporus CBS 931.73]|eukprot:ORX95394.1 hypothetical protein K493DRAFT_337378 [Basidiobolus meristosporus CBS 931.73]
MTTFLAQVGSRLGTSRDMNNRVARTMTYLLFLSRLLVLQFCLQVDNNALSFTSARWMLLQVCPHMFMDVFEHLFQKLLPLHQRSIAEEPALIDIVRKTFQNTRSCLMEHRGAPQFSADCTLFVVHDEAQILGEEHFGRFESLNGTRDDRPLLSPILYGFRNIEGENELTVLTSGTGLSIYTLNWARSSGSTLKHLPGAFTYMEFPGWTSRQSIDTYITSIRNQLPTEDARVVLDSLLPSEARDMLFEKLAGRFRPIVTAIEAIIANGTPGFWKVAIEKTEARLVSWDHQREPGNLIHEIIRLENKYRRNLDVFQHLRTVEEGLGLLLFQRYMFGARTLVLEDAVPEMVERAFGRIMIIDGAARTVLDEPFAMKAAENYVRVRDIGFVKTMEQWMQQSNNASVHGFAWEYMMMSVFVETFKTHPFSDWSHQPSIPSMCASLEGKSEIVGLIDDCFQRGVTHQEITMQQFMEAHVNNNSTRGGKSVPPFYFPKAKPSGPDMVFYIRVNGNLFPVFVQLKLRPVFSHQTTHAALKTVSEECVQEHVENLGDYCPTNNTYISMIIAYPGKMIVSQIGRPNPALPSRSLNQVVVNITGDNFAKIFPPSHVDFLDRIKTPVKRHAMDQEWDEGDQLKKSRTYTCNLSQ